MTMRKCCHQPANTNTQKISFQIRAQPYPSPSTENFMRKTTFIRSVFLAAIMAFVSPFTNASTSCAAPASSPTSSISRCLSDFEAAYFGYTVSVVGPHGRIAHFVTVISKNGSTAELQDTDTPLAAGFAPSSVDVQIAPSVQSDGFVVSTIKANLTNLLSVSHFRSDGVAIDLPDVSRQFLEFSFLMRPHQVSKTVDGSLGNGYRIKIEAHAL